MLLDACIAHTLTHSPSHKWSDWGWAGQPVHCGLEGRDELRQWHGYAESLGDWAVNLGTAYKIRRQRKLIKMKRSRERERQERRDLEMTETTWLTREREQPWFLMGFLFQEGLDGIEVIIPYLTFTRYSVYTGHCMKSFAGISYFFNSHSIPIAKVPSLSWFYRRKKMRFRETKRFVQGHTVHEQNWDCVSFSYPYPCNYQVAHFPHPQSQPQDVALAS